LPRADAVRLRVEVNGPPEANVRVVGLSVAVSPVLGFGLELMTAAIWTAPVNPSMLVTVIVDVAEPPGARDTMNGNAERLKLGPVTVMLIVV
jgi:hypothetical protein